MSSSLLAELYIGAALNVISFLEDVQGPASFDSACRKRNSPKHPDGCTDGAYADSTDAAHTDYMERRQGLASMLDCVPETAEATKLWAELQTRRCHEEVACFADTPQASFHGRMARKINGLEVTGPFQRACC